MPITDTWQFEFDSFVMGTGSEFWVESVEGLNPPDTRTDIQERAEAHGSFTFSGFMQHREITISGDMHSPTNFYGNVDSWRQAFRPRIDDVPLYFRLGDAISHMVWAKPTKRHFPTDVDFSRGLMKWTVQFVCGDPRIYSEAERTNSFTPAQSTTGIDFSLDLPTNFGGFTLPAVGGVLNAGVFPTPWVARIDGPAINPKIVNVNTGEHTELLIELGPNDYIVVDSKEKTVMLNGTASRYDVLPENNVWWDIQPGEQDVRLLAGGRDSNTNLTLTWRDAWI